MLYQLAAAFKPEHAGTAHEGFVRQMLDGF